MTEKDCMEAVHKLRRDFEDALRIKDREIALLQERVAFLENDVEKVANTTLDMA